jgi:hypothetical protein
MSFVLSAPRAGKDSKPASSDRIWWGSGSRETAVWTGEQGMNLMSSTLLLEDTQVPFDQLQAEQIELFREAWARAGHTREPRVSVSRSVIPITSDLDRRLFGADTNEDQVGWLDSAISRFGRSYTGEPDQIADDLAKDAAVQAADTVLLTVPSQLGVDYNAAMLETIAREIAPALGWTPKNLPTPSDNRRGQRPGRSPRSRSRSPPEALPLTQRASLGQLPLSVWSTYGPAGQEPSPQRKVHASHLSFSATELKKIGVCRDIVVFLTTDGRAEDTKPSRRPVEGSYGATSPTPANGLRKVSDCRDTGALENP